MRRLMAEAWESRGRGGASAPTNAPPEQVVWKGKPTVLAFYDGLVGGALLIAVSATVASAFPRSIWLSATGAICGLLLVAFAFIRARANTYIVTDKGVRREYRFVAVRVEEALFENITNTVVEQDVIGRVFGFGDVRLDTAGSPFQGVLFKGVRNPAAVKEVVDKRLKGAPQ